MDSSSLQSSAQDRKAKLAALRDRAKKRDHDTMEDSNHDEVSKETSLRFRNYTPGTDELKKLVQEPPAVGPKAKEVTETVEGKVENVAKEALSKEKELAGSELDIAKLAAASKKQNWDLRRDLEKKLEPLERRTQAVIIDLLRKRIQGSSDKMADAAAFMSTVEMPKSVQVGGDFEDD